jgi:hypothetical protein
VWTGNAAEWKAFKSALAFGQLKWDVSELSDSAVFLDLDLYIDPQTRRIHSRTYFKPMNLFLYIPPASAHPPGVLKSVIYGNLQRFWNQNTERADYLHVARHFAERLIARGHDARTIKQYFLEAAMAIDRRRTLGPRPRAQADPSNTLFFHWEFHPRGVTRRALRHAYKETLEGYSGFERFVIAYSRPRNLRDALMRTRLNEPAGHRASDLFRTRDTGGNAQATPSP